MADELRLGTLGDAVLQTGATIPIPLQGGLSIPTPRFAAADDLPAPPHPLGGGDLMILHGGITIPTP